MPASPITVTAASRALGESTLERGLKQREFRVAPDHARSYALDTATDDAKRTRLGPDDEVAMDRIRNALDHERRLYVDLE